MTLQFRALSTNPNPGSRLIRSYRLLPAVRSYPGVLGRRAQTVRIYLLQETTGSGRNIDPRLYRAYGQLHRQCRPGTGRGMQVISCVFLPAHHGPGGSPGGAALTHSLRPTLCSHRCSPLTSHCAHSNHHFIGWRSRLQQQHHRHRLPQPGFLHRIGNMNKLHAGLIRKY